MKYGLQIKGGLEFTRGGTDSRLMGIKIILFLELMRSLHHWLELAMWSVCYNFQIVYAQNSFQHGPKGSLEVLSTYSLCNLNPPI